MQRAQIEGEGVGAIRHCIFDGGEFREPVQVWDPPRNLTFGVTGQIEKFSPYLAVTKGQFRIEPLGQGRAELVGTTWYRLRIAPGIYWRPWVDFFIHRIHMRALEHIRSLSELELGDASATIAIVDDRHPTSQLH